MIIIIIVITEIMMIMKIIIIIKSRTKFKIFFSVTYKDIPIDPINSEVRLMKIQLRNNNQL